MHSTESVVIKILNPTQWKRQWLDDTARAFSQAVQFGLDAAREDHTDNRTRLHKLVYRAVRDQFGLSADYTRMSVNAVVSLARSYYGQRRSRHIKRVSFPKVNGSQGIGLGIHSYRIVQDNNRLVLRVSTGQRGHYVWLVLCVPTKYRDRLLLAKGDAKLFKRGNDWYVMLPIRVTPTPAVCDGESTFIGVDLGIVRLATVSTPDGITFFSGKEARHRREHSADLRGRYQRHNRLDRVKAQKGKDTRYMRDLNHKISATLVDIALRYDRPVIVLERLDGINNRLKGSKRFKRMVSSWTFRQLVTFIEYKAARYSIPVVFADPRGTSRTCPKCGHSTRANRPNQSRFRCVACNYQGNADAVAAINIAALGPGVLGQEPTDTARASAQTEPVGVRPDVVKVDTILSCQQTTTSSSLQEPPRFGGERMSGLTPYSPGYKGL